ncbi:MAG: efflux RND transporter periplasmic adaptor subunit [Verrucomicrobiota bacterium]
MSINLQKPIRGIAFLFLVITFLKASESLPSPTLSSSVAVTRVTRDDLSKTVELSGEFLAYQEVDLHSKVSGFIKSIAVDAGDRVKAGGAIATLEIPELQDDLTRAKAQTKMAEEEIKKYESKYNIIHSSTVRLLDVAKQQPKLVAQQDIDNTKFQEEEAVASLEIAKQHLEEVRANQNKMMTLLDYSVITAPFDGVITRRFANLGTLIQAGTTSHTQAMPVVHLVDDSKLRLTVPVPEWAVSKLHVGQELSVSVKSMNLQLKGTVSRFSSSIDRATRSMRTEIDIDNQDRKLTEGMYATVKLTTELQQNVLNVPIQSLKMEGSPKVYVLNRENKVEEREVSIGMQTADRVEIKSGLEENNLVLIGGNNRFKPGQVVLPKIVELSESPKNIGGRHG